jgi:hypothetical protein
LDFEAFIHAFNQQLADIGLISNVGCAILHLRNGVAHRILLGV